MEQKSMTALVSAFSRAYHSMNNVVKFLTTQLPKNSFLTKNTAVYPKRCQAVSGFLIPVLRATPPQH